MTTGGSLITHRLKFSTLWSASTLLYQRTRYAAAIQHVSLATVSANATTTSISSSSWGESNRFFSCFFKIKFKKQKKIKPCNNFSDWRVGSLKPKINVNIGLHARKFELVPFSCFSFRVQILSHPCNVTKALFTFYLLSHELQPSGGPWTFFTPRLS